MAVVIAQTARAWFAAALALVVAAAGMSALTASSSSSSLPRMGLAAAVLSGYAAAVAIVTTPRTGRTRRRCLVWGSGVPVLVGAIDLALVSSVAGLGRGWIAAAPWLVGAAVVSLVGPFLPALRVPGVIASAVAAGRRARQPNRRR